MAEEEKAKGETSGEKTAEEKPAEAGEKKEEQPKAKEKKAEKKGKRVRTGKKHLKTDVYKYYKVEGGKAVTSKQHCPRCGPGTWLADHKGRKYCGRCTYTIFEKK